MILGLAGPWAIYKRLFLCLHSPPTSRLTSQTPLETSPEDLLMGPLFLGDGQDPGFVGEDSLQGSEGLAAPTPTPPGQEWDAWVVFLHLFPVSLWLLSLISG